MSISSYILGFLLISVSPFLSENRYRPSFLLISDSPLLSINSYIPSFFLISNCTILSIKSYIPSFLHEWIPDFSHNRCICGFFLGNGPRLFWSHNGYNRILFISGSPPFCIVTGSIPSFLHVYYSPSFLYGIFYHIIPGESIVSESLLSFL